MSRPCSECRQVADDALVFAAKARMVELTPDTHARFTEAYYKLRCWPDVPAAMRLLKKAGIHMVFLFNLTARILDAGIQNSQLDGMIWSCLEYR
jgi:2-haloacid dehalogenase